MILTEKIKENKKQFIASVEWLAGALNVDANWLMAVMFFESHLNHKAKNPVSSAVGLLQWTAETAESLGTSRDALLNMSNVQQLNYVYKYLIPYKGRLNSVGQLYLAVFSPAYLGKPDNYIIPLSAKWVQANKILNVNQDSDITAGEVRHYFASYYDKLKILYPAAISGAILGIGFLAFIGYVLSKY